jgi:hypothetical protein
MTRQPIVSPEVIASVVHEVNRAYCQAIGDNSQRPWAEAEEWQRTAALQGVFDVINGTATTAEQSHDAWKANKIAEGWTYGPVKDGNLKTHPCIVPYSDLPQAEKVKDYLFNAVVQTLTLPGYD